MATIRSMNIEITEGYDHKEEILSLFTEYTNMLISLDEKFSAYLRVQHYDEEIKDLEEKYGRPDGRLYLVLIDGKAAGCIAMRRLDEDKCEMKRLYLRPECRGHHLGEKLVDLILREAKQQGYKEMYLDTLPHLASAVHIYRSRGFQQIECYNDSPRELPTLFFKKQL